MENLIPQHISISDFREILSDIVRKEIREIITDQNSTSEYLTRQETAELLKISLVTLNDWTRKGIIQSYRIGTRVRYKRSEIDQALRATKNLKYRRSGK